MEKKQILQQALKQLNSLLRAGLNVASDEASFSASYSVSSDNLAKINSSELDQAYTVLLQPWAPQKDINALIAQMKALPSPAILFADFVNPVMAGKLRRRSISFVDCAGNVSIKGKPLDLYVKGKKSLQLRSKRVRGRAFNAAGLKLIFAIFNQPQFLHASYRDISNKVNIALGSVGPVIDDLYASGYILDEGERRLVNKKRLYERWVDGYLEKLRPKQILACYTSDDENWWKKASPEDFHGLWGGEVVVAKSTPFMAPETISLYFSSNIQQKKFADFYGLREDAEGEICMYRNFWSPSYAGDENVDGLSPMIVYADIVDAINPGSWDVAKTFYGETIAHLLQD
jgi:hypothetical protein